MKKFYYLLFFSSLLAVCHSCGYSTPTNATPEYFIEEEQVQTSCGQCGGTGLLYGPYGPSYCFVCKGNGYNISFKSRKAYYAECSHHSGCKLFQAKRTGSTTCKCECSKFAHIKRYH